MNQDGDPRTAPPAVPSWPPAWVLGLVAVGMLVPVTLPVPVLRGLVTDRFDVSEFWASAFMSINMVGALLAAPLAGAYADRTGRRRVPIVLALALDSVLFWLLTLELPFAVFLLLRFVEGAAHITALSLLLSLAADRARLAGSGKVMGFVGAGLTFGVAMGAPLGGRLGQHDPLMPLLVGSVLSAVLACLSWLVLAELPSSGARRPGLKDLVAALRRDAVLAIPWAYAFVDRFTVGFFTTTFTLWMKRVHEMPVKEIGILLGLFLGPFSLLSYPFGRLGERWSRTRMLAWGSLVYGVALVTLGLWPVDWYPVIMVGLGVVSAVMFVPSLMLTAELAGPDVKSTALGGFNSAGSLGFLLGPLVGGAVSSGLAPSLGWEISYPTAFGVAGTAEVLCVLCTLGALRRLRAAGRST